MNDLAFLKNHLNDIFGKESSWHGWIVKLMNALNATFVKSHTQPRNVRDSRLFFFPQKLWLCYKIPSLMIHDSWHHQNVIHCYQIRIAQYNNRY